MSVYSISNLDTYINCFQFESLCKNIPSYQRQVHRITQPLFPWPNAKGNRISEGSARVSWYESELLIGQPNGCSPKLSKYQRGVVQKHIYKPNQVDRLRDPVLPLKKTC